MRKSLSILLALFVVFTLKAQAQKTQTLKLISTTLVPGYEGDIEFFAADLKRNHLFLGLEGMGRVDVFDLRTGKHLHNITGFGAPHILLFLPDSDKLLVADAKNGPLGGGVQVVSGEDYKIVDMIKLPPRVDNAVFDPVKKYFYVESGSDEPSGNTHPISIIDTVSLKLIGSFKVPGEASEAMAVDRAGEKLYVNNRSTSQILVVDLRTRQVIATWSIPGPGAKMNTALALDDANHRLFSATREPPKVFVYDTETGKVVTTLPCSLYNDNMIFDPARKRIYVNGTETTTVIQQLDADHYKVLTEVPTGYRAKTGNYFPELNRMYIALSGKDMICSKDGSGICKVTGPQRPGAKLGFLVFQVQP